MERFGLTSAEAAASKQEFGDNSLATKVSEGFFDKFRASLADPMIIILLVALAINLVFTFLGQSEWYESVGIALAVLLATLVAAFSEYRNESAFQKLQDEASAIICKVYRNGEVGELSINDIVVGDAVLLQAGDLIPADGMLVQGSLTCDQSVLNGESEEVSKVPMPPLAPLPTGGVSATGATSAIGATPATSAAGGMPATGNMPAGSAIDFDDPYRLYRGAIVYSGNAVLQVSAVGNASVYGQIAEELRTEEERNTPLKVKLKGLAVGISRFGYIGGILIAVAFLFQGIVVANGFDTAAIAAFCSDLPSLGHLALNAVMLAVIIIVMAVPEGLPLMIAIVSALNMGKMLKAGVLVRQLAGIETAGSLNILFTDKTGTITKGKLETIAFVDGNGCEYRRMAEVAEQLRNILALSLRYNTSAVLSYESAQGAGGEGADAQSASVSAAKGASAQSTNTEATAQGAGAEGTGTESAGAQAAAYAEGVCSPSVPHIFGGNATERAVLAFALDSDAPTCFETVEVVRSQPFNSTNKFSAAQLAGADGSHRLTLIKGAPEAILAGCRYYYNGDGQQQLLDNPELIERRIDAFANRAIRVLALATSDGTLCEEGLPSGNWTLVGILGIRDELRPESAAAIAEVQGAGVQVVMITGDRRETAMAVATDAGLLKDEESLVLTSAELTTKSDDELKALLPRLRVIARALPSDKSRLVRLAKDLNLVVGMTGDGVNDSPALKAADVGFAMGSGTEVAKEASEIIILDDNFSSIDKAILYGRTIFNSIRKFIVFQLTINISAVLVCFLMPLIGQPTPLTITQILWVNLVMDTLAALAFGGEPALRRFMRERPKRRDESIVSPYMWSAILTDSLVVFALSLVFLLSGWVAGFFRPDDMGRYFATGYFTFFIFAAVFNAFNARTEQLNLFDHIGANRGFLNVIALIAVVQVLLTYFGGAVLGGYGLVAGEWLVVLAFAVLIIPVDLLRKAIVRRIFRN